MARTIAFSGLKDGVGKTCLASHIAYLLAHCSYKVLLIDADYKQHELTRRMFGSNALLKILEHEEALYTTLSQVLCKNLPDSFPFSELPLSLWKRDLDQNSGSLSIIPSYYRDPQPFWHQDLAISSFPGLSSVLAFAKNQYDFIIFDTIANSDVFFEEILKHIDSVISLSSPYSYFYSASLEYIEHFSLENQQHSRIFFSLWENMSLDKKEKGTIPFCQDFFSFESKRPLHRKKFFWDIFSVEQNFTLSAKLWTISIVWLLQEILDNTQQSLSKKKMPSFLQSFTQSHPETDFLS